MGRRHITELAVGGLTLRGTAKGGVVLGVCDELKVPIRHIGIGEGIDDLRDFDAKTFADALFARPDA